MPCEKVGSYRKSLTSTDESGWAWFIPLHDGTVSVGVVLHQGIYNVKHKELKTSAKESCLEALYHSTLDRYAPDIKALLNDGELQRNEDGVGVKQASDFSYNAPYHAGPRYRIAGDAGGTTPDRRIWTPLTSDDTSFH